MAYFPNDARNERTGFKEGASSKGEQGANGSGKFKRSGEGDSGKAPDFKPAPEVIGEEILGELPVPGFSVMKGASASSLGDLRKGKAGKPMPNGAVQKPKAAEEAGH